MKKWMITGMILALVAGLCCIAVQTTAASEKEADMRLIQVSPDLPPVDVYVDEELFMEGLEYRQPTPYVSLPAGKVKIELYLEGDEEAFSTEKVKLKKGEKYSVATVGKEDDLSFLRMKDAPGVQRRTAKFRFVHTAPDLPALDVAVASGEVLFENVQFQDVERYLVISPTILNLELRRAGTNEVVLDLPYIQLKEDQIYSLYTIGSAEGDQELEGWLLTELP